MLGELLNLSVPTAGAESRLFCSVSSCPTAPTLLTLGTSLGCPAPLTCAVSQVTLRGALQPVHVVRTRAGLHQHLCLPEAAVGTPVGTGGAADDTLPKAGMGAIQPQGRRRLASERGDTGLWHPDSSVPHESVPAVFVAVTALDVFCVLSASKGFIQEGVILAGVKTELGIWGTRGSTVQVLFIGTGVGGVAVTWRIRVYLGLRSRPWGRQGFCALHALFWEC